MKNISKTMRQAGLLLSICLILLCLQTKAGATESTFSILPFQKTSSTISGKMQPNEKAFLQFKHQLFTVESNAKGEFSFPLKQLIGNEKIVLFQKDKEGYEQKTIEQIATDADSDEANPNRIPPPSYLGIQDNQFVFESKSDYKIYVIYEGQTYSGTSSLRVPKNKSSELKFFGQDDSYGAGKKSKVVVKKANESETLKINSFDVEGSRLKGTAWPYAHLKVLDQEGNLKQRIEIEGDGKIDVQIPLSPSELEEGALFTVQDTQLTVPLFDQKVQIPPFTPSKENPIYFTHDFRSNMITGKTYRDAQVQLDHQDCSSDTTGTFSCSLTISENPTHELTILQIGQQNASVFFDTDFNIEAFPFSLTKPLSSNNAEVNGTTLPNKEFKIEASNGLSVNFTSDATGRFKLKLPNAYNLGYHLFLKNKEEVYKGIKYIEVLDEREIPKPVLKVKNGELIVFNPMYGKDANLKAELLIEKSNGEWDLRTLEFTSWNRDIQYINVPGLQDGDNYILTISKKRNDSNSRTIKGTFKRIMKTEYDSSKSNSFTLTGKTEPFATIAFRIPLLRDYEVSYTVFKNYNATADANGNFKISLNEKQSYRIDYSGDFKSAIVSKDGLRKETYYQKVKDSTSPTIQLLTKYIGDSDFAFHLRSEDRLKKVEIKYFSTNKFISEKLVSPIKSFTFTYDSKKKMTYKANGITKIMVRATNMNQQTSQWSTFKVTNTEFPKLQLKNVYVGDKEIRGKVSNKKPFEIIVNDKKYVAKLSTNGTFKVKLTTPVKKGTKRIKIILKNEVEETQVLSEKVLIRQK